MGLFPAPWDKLAHLGYFGAIAALLAIAAARFPWGVFAVVVLVGAADEWHQLYLPGREASLGDLTADALGAAAGVLAMRARARRRG